MSTIREIKPRHVALAKILPGGGLACGAARCWTNLFSRHTRLVSGLASCGSNCATAACRGLISRINSRFKFTKLNLFFLEHPKIWEIKPRHAVFAETPRGTWGLACRATRPWTMFLSLLRFYGAMGCCLACSTNMDNLFVVMQRRPHLSRVLSSRK